MIVLLLAAVVGLIVAGLTFGVFFMRSSKNLPATWQELFTELQWQIHGFIGIVEDHLLRFKNHTALISQPGRLAVITGGNRGIGLSVVAKLLQCEYTVIMGVRDPAQAKAAIAALPPTTGAGQVHYEQLDIGNMSSVRQFARRVRAQHSRIHLLVNNAGIMTSPYALTAEGFEEQLAVNYLGHFLLAHLLLPELQAAGTAEQRARIVNVSSCVHRMGSIHFDNLHGKKYPPVSYNQSKLAQVLFTKHLQRELSERSVHVQTHSVHPGVVDTGLFCNTTSTYIPAFKRVLFKSAEEGARSIVHAAIAPQLEGKGGSYISNCMLMSTQRAAKDVKLCARLFEVSCAMLGIEEFFVAK